MECFPTQNPFFPARYWDDPHTFKPSRFLKDWSRDAFLPFSAGEE
jgi:cytochrome P450